MKYYQPFRSLRDRILNSLVILWFYHGATAGHVGSVSGKSIYGFLIMYPTNLSDHLTFPFMASSGWHKYIVVKCLKIYWIGCPKIIITKLFTWHYLSVSLIWIELLVLESEANVEVPLTCILSNGQWGWLYWLQKKVQLYVSLWENDSLLPWFITSVNSFPKSLWSQSIVSEWYKIMLIFLHYGPIYSKIMISFPVPCCCPIMDTSL